MPCFDLASMDTLYLHCSLSLLFTPRRCLLKHSPPDLPTLQYLVFVTFLTPAQCLENLLLRLRELIVKGHYSLTPSTFPPYVFDTFTPCEWTFYPLCLTLLPPTIWHITPLFSFFSGIIFCQSFMSSGGVRNSKLSNTRGLPSAWGWWPSSWRMADSEVVCCQKRWWF